jgi:hypothetical protein
MPFSELETAYEGQGCSCPEFIAELALQAKCPISQHLTTTRSRRARRIVLECVAWDGQLTIEELPATQDYVITLALPMPQAGTVSYTMEITIPPP